jgi:membrane associated rhomboid family serine protease
MPRGTIPFALPPFQGWVRRLVVACAAVFLVQKILEISGHGYSAIFTAYAGLVPTIVLHGALWQLVSYSFLHEGIWHLLGNMLGLWMVGSLEETEWGSRRFLEVYFLSVIGGALATIAAASLHVFGVAMGVPTIGASAGILGMLMALAVIDGDREFTILLFFVLPITLKVKYLVGIITFGVIVATIGASNGGVANVAHAGGLLCGFLWAKFVPRRGLAFEASESYYGLHNAYHRWKRRQAAKKFEVYMRKSEREMPRFDDKGNYIPPDDPPRKPNGDSGSGSKWVN